MSFCVRNSGMMYPSQPVKTKTGWKPNRLKSKNHKNWKIVKCAGVFLCQEFSMMYPTQPVEKVTSLFPSPTKKIFIYLTRLYSCLRCLRCLLSHAHTHTHIILDLLGGKGSRWWRETTLPIRRNRHNYSNTKAHWSTNNVWSNKYIYIYYNLHSPTHTGENVL